MDDWFGFLLLGLGVAFAGIVLRTELWWRRRHRGPPPITLTLHGLTVLVVILAFAYAFLAYPT